MFPRGKSALTRTSWGTHDGRGGAMFPGGAVRVRYHKMAARFLPVSALSPVAQCWDQWLRHAGRGLLSHAQVGRAD